MSIFIDVYVCLSTAALSSCLFVVRQSLLQQWSAEEAAVGDTIENRSNMHQQPLGANTQDKQLHYLKDTAQRQSPEKQAKRQKSSGGGEIALSPGFGQSICASPCSVAERRRRRSGANRPPLSSPVLSIDARLCDEGGEIGAEGGWPEKELDARYNDNGVVIASLSPTVLRVHNQLINQGVGGLPELNHSTTPCVGAAHRKTSPLLGGGGHVQSPMVRLTSMSLSSLSITPSRTVGSGSKSPMLSPLAGARLQGSVEQMPLSMTQRSCAKVSSSWTGAAPYRSNIMTRLFSSPSAAIPYGMSSAAAAATGSGDVSLSWGSISGIPRHEADLSALASLSPSHFTSNTLSSHEASLLLRANLSQKMPLFQSTAEQVGPARHPLSQSPTLPVLGDSGWKNMARGYDAGEGRAAEASVSRVLAAPPSPPFLPTSAVPTPANALAVPRDAGESARKASLFSRVFGRPGGGGQRTKEKVRGTVYQASHVFRVVHPEGVQYRKTPQFEARVYGRKWWDTHKHQRGPNFGDVVYGSSVETNWVQVAGQDVWLPILSATGQALLELDHIVGAYKDSSHAACVGGVGGSDASSAGGWNPLLSARSATLSVNRLSVHFAAGRSAVTLAEAGFDAGRHLTVFRILSLERYAYIGVTELPADPTLVNTSHLGLFGFAIGGAPSSHAHTRKHKTTSLSGAHSVSNSLANTPTLASTSFPSHVSPPSPTIGHVEDENGGVVGKETPQNGVGGRASFVGGEHRECETRDDDADAFMLRIWHKVCVCTCICVCVCVWICVFVCVILRV